MFKKCLLILAVIGLLPVQAGELEKALSENENVFLYMYTKQCGFCTKFSPLYEKLSKTYNGQYKFVKIDAATPYGYSIMNSYGGRYVPYVLLLNQKNKLAVNLAPSCLMNNMCVERELKNFSK